MISKTVKLRKNILFLL
nr:unnamed protein product [Callosobruchus chinensis]